MTGAPANNPLPGHPGPASGASGMPAGPPVPGSAIPGNTGATLGGGPTSPTNIMEMLQPMTQPGGMPTGAAPAPAPGTGAGPAPPPHTLAPFGDSTGAGASASLDQSDAGTSGMPDASGMPLAMIRMLKSLGKY